MGIVAGYGSTLLIDRHEVNGVLRKNETEYISKPRAGGGYRGKTLAFRCATKLESARPMCTISRHSFDTEARCATSTGP